MAENEAVERDQDQTQASGADSGEGKARQREDQEPAATGGGEDEQSEESRKAKEKDEAREKAKEEMKEIEEDPPANLEDWPDGPAKYETFGGPDGGHSYEDGPEVKLGPSSLRHHEDGSVTIAGEEVDEPDKYKGEPIPGGPTDENSPDDMTAKKIKSDQKGEDSDE